MNRNRKHVGPLVEDALRAVAVMYVNIEDRHTLVLVAQALRRDGRVVQKAETACHVGEGMMAGRPAERVDLACAVAHEVGRCDRGIARGKSGVPGARADGTSEVG